MSVLPSSSTRIKESSVAALMMAPASNISAMNVDIPVEAQRVQETTATRATATTAATRKQWHVPTVSASPQRNRTQKNPRTFQLGVPRPDSGQDGIHHRQMCDVRGDKGTDLCHDGNHSQLPDVGTFAAHVGSGDDDEATAKRKKEIRHSLFIACIDHVHTGTPHR